MIKGNLALTLGAMFLARSAFADELTPKGRDRVEGQTAANENRALKPEEQTSEGSVAVAGSRNEHRAVAGTLVVHPKEWDDAAKAAGEDPMRCSNY